MSDLVLRRPPFRYDGVDFLWNADNPAFSVLANSVSFQVIGFEKYICRSMRDAEKRIDDPAMLAETRLFNAQESVHSQTHKRHVDVLIARHPGLRQVLDESVADYEDIYRANELRFNLAYAANVEATFTPLFSSIIRHRDALMGKGDARVASTLLWHFCEEVEHRSSALAVYDHVVGDTWYRVRKARRILGHVRANAAKIIAGFVQHVPEVKEEHARGALARLPLLARIALSIDLIASQAPWHDPKRVKVPAYYHEWRRRYEAGEDMTQIYGVRIKKV
jgi:predicted metal-dependent hydrolase